MAELISLVITMAKKGIPTPRLTTRTLAHRATEGLCFPRPLPRGGRAEPVIPLDLPDVQRKTARSRVSGALRRTPKPSFVPVISTPCTDSSSETQLDPDPSRQGLQGGSDRALKRRSTQLPLGRPFPPPPRPLGNTSAPSCVPELRALEGNTT